MTIVTYNHRRKRARKRKQSPAIPMRIVSAKKPGPAAPAIKEAVTERKRPSVQAATITSRIVTAPRKTSTRFGPVQDLDAEEHRRRGDAAEALFREIVRRAKGDGWLWRPRWQGGADDRHRGESPVGRCARSCCWSSLLGCRNAGAGPQPLSEHGNRRAAESGRV